ncbi:MAG: DNA repair exonuclease [Pseudomonadota bacterium]|nr:DNA repair exonuclease [Pseudomonadota bacterium]
MRFIHAADIHLDSPLTGLAAYADAPAQLLRTATRDAFANLVTVAVEEKVDFMVIAGDLYDGNWKDFNTGIFFVRQMGRLKLAGIPVYLLYGNHDAESEMTKTLTLPDNVHRFPSKQAATFTLPALKVALHGRSFKDAATLENLALGYPDPLEGWFNIGVLHTALEGNAAHANYAPCSIAELEARGYQYWALGHVHEYRVWRGASVIAFPGNLQGRHIREPGPRGALMVSVEGGDITDIERLHVDVLRWHALDVDVAGAASMAEALRMTGRGLEQLVGETGAVPLAVRVTLTGATPAHGELFGLESQLRAEVLAQAAVIGSERLWIEKVRLGTSPQLLATDLSARSDAVADLQALLLKAEFDPVFMQSLEDDLMQLVGKLPLEVIAALPSVAAVREGHTDSLVRSIGPALLDHVAKAG